MPPRDGIDATFKINYVAPYALTRLLAPALNVTAGRVVTLTSALHRDARLDPSHPGKGPLRPTEAYAQAHLALMLFTRMLARISQHPVTAVAVHPGYVDTGSFTAVYGPGGLPVADGAAAVLYDADPATDDINGGYYEGLLLAQPAGQARDDQAARRGGYPSQAAARQARDDFLAASAADRTARGWTVERWLRHWLGSRTSIRATTRFRYPRRRHRPHPAPRPVPPRRPRRPTPADRVRRDRRHPQQQ